MHASSRLRSGIVAGLLAVLCVGVVLLVGALKRSSRQFEGRSIQQWVRVAASGKDPAAEQVLRRVDPECLPELAKWAGDHRSAIAQIIRKWWPKIPRPVQSILPDPGVRDACTRVSLIALARHTNWGPHTALILRSAVGPAAAVGGASSDTERIAVFDAMHRRVRRDPAALADTNCIAVVALGAMHRNPWIQYHSLVMLGIAGPGATSALPVVKARMTAKGRTIAQHAAGTVWRISGERREPMVLLLVSLASRDQPTLDWAHRYLYEMAPETLPLLPGWKVLMTDNPPPTVATRWLLPFPCGPGGPLLIRTLEKLTEAKDADLAAASREALDRLLRAAENPRLEQ